ncbi:MAG: zinc ribbon domain-containing protein [Anaerolineae bacterium]|jgi:putative FmdB family regulatory protein
MPLYEFYCVACHHCFDTRRTLSEGTEHVTCPLCDGQEVRRVFTPVMAFSPGGGRSAAGGGACTGCTLSRCASCPGGSGK